jgi:hypothetical protein
MKTDELDRLSRSLKSIANAITPLDACGAHDEEGGFVSSLTEAIMGHTKAVGRVANAIESLADAVRHRD